VFLRAEDDRERGLARLVEALETDLQWRDEHTRLAGRAREWLDGERDASYLLRGADLREAEAWLTAQEGHREAPTREQAEYIARSRQAAGRRLRVLVGALASGLAIAIALAVFALIQRQDAINNQHVSQSQADAAKSTAALGFDALQAVRLALQAVAAKPTAGAVLALRQAVGADQLRRVLRGDPSIVLGVAFDPSDRDIAATASTDGTVEVWNAASGRVLGRFPRIVSASDNRNDLAFSATGDLLAAGGAAGAVHVWNARTGAGVLPGLTASGGTVTAVAFSPDTPELAAGTAGGTVTVWQTRGPPSPIVLRGPADISVTALGWSPDSKSLVIGYHNGYVLLLGPTGKALPGHRADVGNATFSPNGQRIVTADVEAVARLWSASGSLVAPLTVEEEANGVTFADTIIAAAFSSDSQLVALGYSSGRIAVFDAGTGALVDTIKVGAVGVADLAFLSNDYLAVSYFDASSRVWDPYNDAQITLLVTGDTPISAAAVNADSTRLAAAGTDGTVRLWEPFPGRVIEHAAGQFAGLTPDGRSIVIQAGNRLMLRGPSGERSLGSLGSEFSFISPPWFSPDSRLIAIPQAASITIENLDNRRRTRLTGSAPNVVSQAAIGEIGAFNPDDTRFVAPVASGGVTIWNTATGAIVRHLRTAGATIEQAAFSPDGRLIAAAGANDVTYLQRASGGPVHALHDPAAAPDVAMLAFSPDGGLLATTSDVSNSVNTVVRLWNTSTDQPVGRTLTGNGGFVTFSPDGRRLATELWTGGVNIFSVGSHGLLAKATHLDTGPVNGAIFSPDGQLIVGGSESGPAVYDLASGQLVARFGATRVLYTFAYGPQGLLATSAEGASLYACDACGSTSSVIRNARALLSAAK